MDLRILTALTRTTLILACALVTLAAKPKLIAEITKVECENQRPQLLQITNCYVNLSAYYVDFELTEDVDNLNGTFVVQVERGRTFVSYLNLTLDYCEALHEVHSQYMIQMIAVELRRITNFPLNCPLKKNVRFYVDGFAIDPKVLRIYTPQLSFRTVATFVSNRHKILRFTTLGRIARE